MTKKREQIRNKTGIKQEQNRNFSGTKREVQGDIIVLSKKLTTTPRKINCFGTYTHMCTAIWAVKQSCEKQEDEFLASWQMVAGTIIHIGKLPMETAAFPVNSYLCLRLALAFYISK